MPKGWLIAKLRMPSQPQTDAARQALAAVIGAKMARYGSTL